MVTMSDLEDLTQMIGRRVKITKTYSPMCYAGTIGTVTATKKDGARTIVTLSIETKPGRHETTSWLRREGLDELQSLEVIGTAPAQRGDSPPLVVANASTLLTLL